MRFTDARRLLNDAIRTRAFPAAVAEAGTRRAVLWQEALGRLTYDEDSAPAAIDTVFDLASLTKVVCTATLVMQLAEEHRLDLADPLARWLPRWKGEERDEVTIEDALSHATGLPAWLPLYEGHRGRGSFLEAIEATALEYRPRSRSVYSDLGFILLGFIAERAGGATLDQMFGRMSARFQLGDISYLPPDRWLSRTAPSEQDPWRGRLLKGEVHDENAAALGGVAGHSGLFGTAAAVGTFARSVLGALSAEAEGNLALASQETMSRFTTRRDVPGSSRALGWDTMLPTSSCGNRMSPLAFGHTGFTGTSLWIDPAAGIYVVLLTNRVYPSRNNERIREIRPVFHDAVMAALQA